MNELSCKLCRQHRLSSMVEQDRSDQGKFTQGYDEPLAKRVRGARFPPSIDAVSGELPDQSDFIRTAIIIIQSLIY